MKILIFISVIDKKIILNARDCVCVIFFYTSVFFQNVYVSYWGAIRQRSTVIEQLDNALVYPTSLVYLAMNAKKTIGK